MIPKLLKHYTWMKLFNLLDALLGLESSLHSQIKLNKFLIKLLLKYFPFSRELAFRFSICRLNWNPKNTNFDGALMKRKHNEKKHKSFTSREDYAIAFQSHKAWSSMLLCRYEDTSINFNNRNDVAYEFCIIIHSME